MSVMLHVLSLVAITIVCLCVRNADDRCVFVFVFV